MPSGHSTSPGYVNIRYRGLSEFPPDLKKKKKIGKAFITIDASHNKFRSLESIRGFDNLHTLLLDHNQISSTSRIPPLPSLEVLWLNHNQIANVTAFIDRLVPTAPRLRYLSILCNEACPNFFNGSSLKQYNDYRAYVISRLPGLTMLDAAEVTDQERADAKRRYPASALPSVTGTIAHSTPVKSRVPDSDVEIKPSPSKKSSSSGKNHKAKRRGMRGDNDGGDGRISAGKLRANDEDGDDSGWDDDEQDEVWFADTYTPDRPV
eukprot:TRINITY_DN12618_c0_g1_i1.p1 TRINITY_DN12618_c0_g1~~TRINITY_DN12618_c0_g1_i1.p1  ORF type:complete len:264 (+),score=46.74 TRINITY_DN12618_c0_g1_i1:66-857(+)